MIKSRNGCATRGCGFIDCAKAVAELERAVAELARRRTEDAAAGKCDPGHDKAIEQAKNRVRNAAAKAAKCITAEDMRKILDTLKSLGDDLNDLGIKIWNWFNNDPRQNWPSFYGPGRSPVPLPLPIRVPVPVPI